VSGTSQTSGIIVAVNALIERLCRTVGDSRELRHAVLAELRRVVGFDACVWLLTDPETSVGAAPIADVPGELLPRLPELIRLKYLTPANRWTGLGAEAATIGDGPSRSLVWQELLHGYGVADVASCVFRDRYGCWGFLDLWREGKTFTPDEVAVLTTLVGPLTAGLRYSQAQTFATPLPGPGDRGRPRIGPVVLLLADDLRVLGQTPDTDVQLRALVPPSDGRDPIPASAYNVGAQLLAVELGVDGNPALARVHLAAGVWVSLRAARVGGVTGNIAVTIEECSTSERAALFGRAHGLSPREAELLEHLLTGADTKEVASRMFVSANTVQDHLKSIFAKTGTRNRPSLVSRALGT
jgi:DNA-binding CsgD family transcriptional regulator